MIKRKKKKIEIEMIMAKRNEIDIGMIMNEIDIERIMNEIDIGMIDEMIESEGQGIMTKKRDLKNMEKMRQNENILDLKINHQNQLDPNL